MAEFYHNMVPWFILCHLKKYFRENNMADGEEPEKKRRRIEELLAEKMVVDGGCGDTGDWEGRWNHVKKFLERSGPFTHPDFELSTESRFC